jgi:hypothetical protein
MTLNVEFKGPSVILMIDFGRIWTNLEPELENDSYPFHLILFYLLFLIAHQFFDVLVGQKRKLKV